MHSHADRQSQGKAGDRLTTTSAAGETTIAEELGEMHRQPSLDTTLSVCHTYRLAALHAILEAETCYRCTDIRHLFRLAMHSLR
jgi:hypothetical protein